MIGPITIDEAHFLYAFVTNLGGTPITGAVIGDFTVSFYRNATLVSPHGLFLHEIGGGLYHWSNRGSGAYVSPAKEECILLYQHTPSGTGLMKLEWYSLYQSTVIQTTESVLLNAVNTVIQKVLQGQSYKVGDYYIRYPDVRLLIAFRTLLTDELAILNQDPRSALAQIADVL